MATGDNLGSPMVELSDQEFVDNLRAAVERYLAGVDRWEAAYQRYYRMPGRAERVSADLEAEQRNEIEHFFMIYKDLEPGKRTSTRGWSGPDEALATIEDARLRAQRTAGRG